MSMDLVTEKEILEPLVDGQEVLWSLCTHSGSCTTNTPIYHYRAIILRQDHFRKKNDYSNSQIDFEICQVLEKNM